MILDPRGLSVIEWTDYINLDVGTQGIVPRLDDPDGWREWAAAVNLLPGISKHLPPNPYEYDDWMAWAFRFNETVELTG